MSRISHVEVTISAHSGIDKLAAYAQALDPIDLEYWEVIRFAVRRDKDGNYSVLLDLYPINRDADGSRLLDGGR